MAIPDQSGNYPPPRCTEHRTTPVPRRLMPFNPTHVAGAIIPQAHPSHINVPATHWVPALMPHSFCHNPIVAYRHRHPIITVPTARLLATIPYTSCRPSIGPDSPQSQAKLENSHQCSSVDPHSSIHPVAMEDSMQHKLSHPIRCLNRNDADVLSSADLQSSRPQWGQSTTPHHLTGDCFCNQQSHRMLQSVCQNATSGQQKRKHHSTPSTAFRQGRLDTEMRDNAYGPSSKRAKN